MTEQFIVIYHGAVEQSDRDFIDDGLEYDDETEDFRVGSDQISDAYRAVYGYDKSLELPMTFFANEDGVTFVNLCEPRPNFVGLISTADLEMIRYGALIIERLDSLEETIKVFEEELGDHANDMGYGFPDQSHVKPGDLTRDMHLQITADRKLVLDSMRLAFEAGCRVKRS